MDVSYFWYDYGPAILIVGGFLGLAAAVFLLIGVAVYAADSTSCGDLGDQTGRETTYSIWTGCYVRVGDQWVPDDNWRIPEALP